MMLRAKATPSLVLTCRHPCGAQRSRNVVMGGGEGTSGFPMHKACAQPMESSLCPLVDFNPFLCTSLLMIVVICI